MNSTTIASDTMPTRSERRRRQASVHRPGETVCGMSRGVCGAAVRNVARSVAKAFSRYLELHARIDCLVGQVREQVGGDGGERDVHGDRLDAREVGALDGQA